LAPRVPDETDPPRKHYGFKDREFKRDNLTGAEAGAAPTAQDLAKMAGPVTRSAPVGGSAKAGDPNDVYAILQQNRAAETKAGGDEVEIRKVRFRRTRDYWLMLLAGNIVLVGGGLFFGGAAIVFALAGVIIYSLGLTWVVWQLMSKY
jgi:hypothetical protein